MMSAAFIQVSNTTKPGLRVRTPGPAILDIERRKVAVETLVFPGHTPPICLVLLHCCRDLAVGGVIPFYLAFFSSS